MIFIGCLNSFFNNNYVFETNKNKMTKPSKDITIKTVTNAIDLKEFYNFPFKLYKNDSNWVAPFWIEFKEFFKKKNPFWKHAEVKLFIAYKNDEIIGRIGAIVDDFYCNTCEEKIGFFGFFECVQDYKCAEALFESVQNWFISKEIIKIQGPINGRVDQGCGFLYKGFDLSHSLLSSYSPKYYISFAEKFGMKKTRDLLTYYIDLKKPIPTKLHEKALRCASTGLKIRQFNRLRTNNELKWWIKFFLECFENHWGYVPVSENEVKYRFGIKQLRWIVDTRLFLIAEYEGSPVAFIWANPDYNQIFRKMKGSLGLFNLVQFLFKKQRINKGILHIIGIKKEFRNKDIGSFLNYETLVEMKNRGYIGAEVNLIDEENVVAHNTISATGAEVYKRFRVFEKELHIT